MSEAFQKQPKLSNSIESNGLKAAKREFYLRSVVKYATIGVAAVLIIVVILNLISVPKFDEGYVRGLLALHDPELAFSELTDIASEEPNGRATVSSIASPMFKDSNNLPGSKEIEILADTSGNTISGSITVFSSVTMNATDRGTKRMWNCPDETEYNMSVEINDRYFYIGTENTYLLLLQLQTIVQEAGGLNSSIEPSWNESWNADFWNVIDKTAPWLRMSEMYYYSPSERAAFDDKLAEIEDLLKDCEEIE